jgi:hypothetical protein
MIALARLVLWLRKAAQGFFRLAGAYPLQAALIALVALSAWLWWGKSRAIDQRDEAMAAKAAQIEEYRRAYRETFTLHMIAKQAEDARQRANTEKADAVTEANRRAALAAADNYAGRMRCEPQADQGAARGSDMSGSPADPRGSETGRATADMVAITRADLDACTLNSADLQTAVVWARGME